MAISQTLLLALAQNPELLQELVSNREQEQQQALLDQTLGQAGVAGLPGFQTFVSPMEGLRLRERFPVAPVGPGTLGGAPFQVSRQEEVIRGVGGILANVLEAMRVRKKRRGSKGEALDTDFKDILRGLPSGTFEDI